MKNCTHPKEFWMSAFVPVNPNFILIWTIISGIGDRTRVSLIKDALDLSANHPHPLAFSLVAKPGLFLFIFVLFKHKFYGKNCCLMCNSNSDSGNRRQACWPLDPHNGPPIGLQLRMICTEQPLNSSYGKATHLFVTPYFNKFFVFRGWVGRYRHLLPTFLLT